METLDAQDPHKPVEHLDVLIVGAGLSGISAAHFVKTECPWASYALFEARDSIGGTWDLFRYPGIRSDSDMFTLGFSFRPWQGEKSIADGESILQYIKDTAAEEGIDRKIRFGHKIISADWSSADSLWRITAERSSSGEQFELTAGFLYSCTGYYRYDHGYQPEFAGLADFRGEVIHPQQWPADLDYADKNVVVIGSGATAVTLVPSLARTAKHVTMLQRSPTYIATLPAKNPIANSLRKYLPKKLSGPTIRWMLALQTQAFYTLSKRRPEFVKKTLLKEVTKRLPDGYDVEKNFTPSYNPWDQRVCVVPNGDLFKAMRAGSAEVVTDTIDTFTKQGVLLNSGTELPADIVVTATGLELLFLGGIELSVDGEQVDIGSKLTYKGMMLEGVPNLGVAIGYTNASWTLKCELTCAYICRLLNRMHDDGYSQCTPKNSDGAMAPEPLLDLTSGYVQRSAGLLPKQGSRFPWKVYQSYVRDYPSLKFSKLNDGAMQFSGSKKFGEMVSTPTKTGVSR